MGKSFLQPLGRPRHYGRLEDGNLSVPNEWQYALDDRRIKPLWRGGRPDRDKNDVALLDAIPIF